VMRDGAELREGWDGLGWMTGVGNVSSSRACGWVGEALAAGSVGSERWVGWDFRVVFEIEVVFAIIVLYSFRRAIVTLVVLLQRCVSYS
jgi:hypothetical protein